MLNGILLRIRRFYKASVLDYEHSDSTDVPATVDVNLDFFFIFFR